jgi:hypothetical protein
MEAGVLAVYIPERLVVEARRRGFDVESLAVELLARVLNLDPQVVSDIHLELSHRYLGEGRALVGKDPVQASEKLYKAAEEAVKALVIFYNLQDVLAGVEEKGRWTVPYLEKAVEAISERLGGWFGEAWDRAWALHVWGFHEAKLDSKAVEMRLPYVERIVLETERVIQGERAS